MLLFELFQDLLHDQKEKLLAYHLNRFLLVKRKSKPEKKNIINITIEINLKGYCPRAKTFYSYKITGTYFQHFIV